MSWSESPLKEAIAGLPLPIIWPLLGLPGKVTEKCNVRSPLRDDDREASFSIYAGGTRFKDHGTGEGGDSFNLYQCVKKMDAKSARRPFIELSKGQF